MCPDTERCFLCVRVRLCLRVFPISRSSLIIELILSSLLGRYTAASHSVFLSFSSLLRRSILPSPYFHLCRSPVIYHPFSFLTPLSSLSLMCSPSLRPFPQLSFLTNPSCSLTSLSPSPSAAPPPPHPSLLLHPTALHHPSPLAYPHTPPHLAPSSRGERSALPLHCQTQTGCNQTRWRGGTGGRGKGDEENEDMG